MPARGAFPLELVNQVIDELGAAPRQDYFPVSHSYKAALHACALVSKKWTARSRAQLFKEVKIVGDKLKSIIPPPASILPYVKELEVYYNPTQTSFIRHEPTQPTSIRDFLKAFVAAPIERLGITGGVLVDERTCIQGFIDTHSATLQIVEFQSCALSAYNIVDILLGHHRLRSIRLVDCQCQELPPPGQPLIAGAPNPNARSNTTGIELRISEGHPLEGCSCIITMVAELPYRFNKLDIEHTVAGEGTTEAMNALIEANADVLSSLRVRFIAIDMDVDTESDHLFSLESCSNLSELTLDMKNSESCGVRDSIFVLSTLNPARLSHLGKIVLKYRYVRSWFNEDGQPYSDENQANSEDDQSDSEDGQTDYKIDWEGLDTLLTKLTKASISTREKRLTFTLVVLEWSSNKERMPVVRKWLPKLLPRFNELGLLHVHHGQGRNCRAVDDSYLCHDKPECLREDFHDGY